MCRVIPVLNLPATKTNVLWDGFDTQTQRHIELHLKCLSADHFCWAVCILLGASKLLFVYILYKRSVEITGKHVYLLASTLNRSTFKPPVDQLKLFSSSCHFIVIIQRKYWLIFVYLISTLGLKRKYAFYTVQLQWSSRPMPPVLHGDLLMNRGTYYFM